MLDCDPEIHIICFCVQLKWLIWAIPKSEPFFRPFSLFIMLYEGRQGIGAIIVPACQAVPGDHRVDFVFPPGWRGTSLTLGSRLGLRTKCEGFVSIYYWLVSIQYDLMKITEMFEKVVTWWSCAGKDRRGKVWWWRLLKWRKHLNTAIIDIFDLFVSSRWF